MTVAVPSPAGEAPRLRSWVVRERRTGVSLRVEPRTVLVTVALFALVAVAALQSLSWGTSGLAYADVVDGLFGTSTRRVELLLGTRLPRVALAVLAGVAFGMSGALVQQLARNPLASPDIIGVSQGGAAAAAYVLVVRGASSSAAVVVAAVVGSTLTMVAVYLLARRRGLSGYRLVLVGIGMTAMLQTVTSWCLTRARIWDAQEAMFWLTGSLSSRNWDHVRWLGWALVPLVPITLVLARNLRSLALGDEAARALGTRVETARGALLACAVLLAGTATAVAGPIAFVALAAPHIARRLVRTGGAALVSSAGVGALLLVVADVIGRVAFDRELAVGVITGVLGAPFLLALLVRANRLGTGG